MTNPLANITKMVYDFLLVEITDPTLFNQDSCFEYSILSQDEKPVRKGRFFGANVQLRLTQMEEGSYSLRLYLNGGEAQNFTFVKRSASSLQPA